MSPAETRFEHLLGEAEASLPRYLEATGELSREKKGIRRSELFFFYALVAPLKPKGIVESGRARAQSTLVLSRLFPKASIVSLESDTHSPDVALAADVRRAAVAVLAGLARTGRPTAFAAIERLQRLRGDGAIGGDAERALSGVEAARS